MIKALYNLLIHLFSPLLLAILYWPKKGKPSFGKRWPEHLGFVPPAEYERPVWLHAVSVGEIIAATPLIKALKSEQPELPILVTTTTRTGADLAEKLGDIIEHRYAPLDFPWAIALFLNRIKPRALVIMETELWPNWLSACAKRGLPVIVVNARLSARSARRYQRFHGVFHLLSKNIDHIACQYNSDAQHFKNLGVSENKLSVTGSIKFDIDYSAEIQNQGRVLRAKLGAQRPIWIAASTHEGEDEQLLDAHQTLLQSLPHALLILVPRHPQRFAEVGQLVEQQGLVLSKRTEQKFVAGSQVYLGDTMGELPLMLAAADIAFIGGSLIERGGHNLLEPAALGKAVLTGPHVFNFSEIYQLLNEKNAIITVHNSTELYTEILNLLRNTSYQDTLAENALNVVNNSKGAISKITKRLNEIIKSS